MKPSSRSSATRVAPGGLSAAPLGGPAESQVVGRHISEKVMKKRIITMVLGMGFIALGVLSLIYYGRLSFFTSSRIGWKCPPGLICSPGPNAMGMRITYPRAIKLSNSKPISVEAYIYNLQSWGLSCSTSLDAIRSIDYEAQLSTGGVEVSPESTQMFTDNTILQGSSATWTWIVYPRQPGTYTFHIKVSATTQECQLFNLDDIFEIQVVDIFGLSAQQLMLLGLISGFLGSALTVPGILAIWAKLRETRINESLQDDDKTAILVVSPSGEEKRIRIKSKDRKRRR